MHLIYLASNQCTLSAERRARVRPSGCSSAFGLEFGLWSQPRAFPHRQPNTTGIPQASGELVRGSAEEWYHDLFDRRVSELYVNGTRYREYLIARHRISINRLCPTRASCPWAKLSSINARPTRRGAWSAPRSSLLTQYRLLSFSLTPTMYYGRRSRRSCSFVLVLGLFASRASADFAVCQSGWEWVSDIISFSISKQFRRLRGR